MIPLSAADLKPISGFLEKYDQKSAVSQLGGLLTAPSLQANAVRIELLAHLAVLHCRGRRKPGRPEIRNWLNRHLQDTNVSRLEDPSEDVFITNVTTPEGNYRLFEGIWESNDYFVQITLDTLGDRRARKEYQDLLTPAIALLKLSDCVAERLGLLRWHQEQSTPKVPVRLAPATRMDARAGAVIFSGDDLISLGIEPNDLNPFILTDHDREVLFEESLGNTSLEKRPLINFGEELILALPNAAGPALRSFVLSELKRLGWLDVFGEELAALQAQQTEKYGLRELRYEAKSLETPDPDGRPPPLHGWLLKYDINKYLHVVLLHDRLDSLEEQGLSSFIGYSDTYRDALEKYLNKVSNHCKSLPDFVEGTTVLILGGLGRGFALELNEWTSNWRLTSIGIADFLMLSNELERPLTRYLKFIKQKEWAEGEGVHFHNVNGDYNFYCFWRRVNYQLVPRDLPINAGSMVAIGPDMVLPVRKELRKLLDHHCTLTPKGDYSPVMRYGQSAFFKSMQGRPVYVSTTDLESGMLAGVVETHRGPSWLTVSSGSHDANLSHLLYELWSGFIGLYDALVHEIEALTSEETCGAIEIALDFNSMAFPIGDLDTETGNDQSEPKIQFNPELSSAEIIFPEKFLVFFQRPENTGERLVLRAIARGLIGVHKNSGNAIDENVIDRIMSSVIGDSDMRVIHLFRTRYPVEHLLWKQSQKPIFLADEDFVFSKLRLSEGCTSVVPGTSITSKSDCNDFLHKVVDKIWNQIRKQLRQFDRASVLREILRVHEALLQDRAHWRQTALALNSLFGSGGDVHAVAQERESNRNNTSLPARTALEMAICECPEKDGRYVSRCELDELLAKVGLMIEVATHSDAINGDLIEPKVKLYLNGEYSIDRSFHNSVIKPFLASYFREGFEAAAGEYHKLYDRAVATERIRIDDVFSSSFIAAFKSEFGLRLDEAADGLAELMDLAVDMDDAVVESTLGNLKERLTRNRGLSAQAVDAFIQTFSISHRPAWDNPPSGFTMKDIFPWRFRRRLSATARPIFLFGKKDADKVFFGAGSLRLGFSYLVERAENGQLPQDFFKSPQMKTYVGAVNAERGLLFAREVADRLRRQGWEARNEVQMTELGAQAEFGDVDVLAWKPTGKIIIIECKRLQLARTVAEIAEICRRFKGEAKDELDKHVQRVNWIIRNPTSLQGIVGYSPNPGHIDDRLVTNTHVPMMYLDKLPIDPRKIGPLEISASSLK